MSTWGYLGFILGSIRRHLGEDTGEGHAHPVGHPDAERSGDQTAGARARVAHSNRFVNHKEEIT